MLSLKTPDHQHQIFYQQDTDQVHLHHLSSAVAAIAVAAIAVDAIAVDAKKEYAEINIAPLSGKEHNWQSPFNFSLREYTK